MNFGCEGVLEDAILQLEKVHKELDYQFYFKNASRAVRIFNEREFALSSHMAPPVEIDMSRRIISPMPGQIVSVAVAKGDEVLDGQEVCVIEAMKMQNIIKSERSGVIKNITIAAGVSVGVDELLVEFE